MRDKKMRTSSSAAVVWLAVSISCCTPAPHDHDDATSTEKHEQVARSMPELALIERISEAELDPLTDDDIWELAILRFAWNPSELPQDWSRDDLVKAFLEDERIKDYEDGIGYGELGYDGLEYEEE